MKKYENNDNLDLNINNNDHNLIDNEISLNNDHQKGEGVFKLKKFNNIMDKIWCFVPNFESKMIKVL